MNKRQSGGRRDETRRGRDDTDGRCVRIVKRARPWFHGCQHADGCHDPANVTIDNVPYCPRHASTILLAVYGVWARPIGERVEEHDEN